MSCTKFRAIILLISVSISSCYEYGNFRFDSGYQVLETEDGVFKVLPTCSNAKNDRYIRLEANGKSILLYAGFGSGKTANFSFDSEEKVLYSDDVVNPILYIKPYLNNNGVDISMPNGYFDDSSWKDWKQVAHIREAGEDEIDAKYYACQSYKSNNNAFNLLYIPVLNGWYFDDSGQKINNVYYLGESSLFTFRLQGKYNDTTFYFFFEKNKCFSIINNEKKIKGTYTSTTDGMILHFDNDEFYGFENNDLELIAYYDHDVMYQYSGQHDLTKYYQELHQND